ncbi:MAG: hypothetical protein WD648_12235 [Planctomycetaceae bacterium]
MPVRDAARLMSRLSVEPITEQILQANIDVGAPSNADGTLNLVHYAAWLVKETSRVD